MSNSKELLSRIVSTLPKLTETDKKILYATLQRALKEDSPDKVFTKKAVTRFSGCDLTDKDKYVINELISSLESHLVTIDESTIKRVSSNHLYAVHTALRFIKKYDLSGASDEAIIRGILSKFVDNIKALIEKNRASNSDSHVYILPSDITWYTIRLPNSLNKLMQYNRSHILTGTYTTFLLNIKPKVK